MTGKFSKPDLMEVEEIQEKAEQTAEAATVEVTEEAIPTPAAEDDLGKVQELLFGNQLRAINQKIMLVHKDFKQSISDLDSKLDSKMSEFDETTKREFSSLTEQLRAETKARENAVENSGMELRKSGNNLQDRINAMEKTHSAAKNSLEDQMRQAVRDLERAVEETRAELQSQLDGEATKLNDNKVDRAALSELLGGIAQQISSIDNIPTVSERTEGASNDPTPAGPPNTRKSA